MSSQSFMDNLTSLVAGAVSLYWNTRLNQQSSQNTRGRTDQGSRSAVTGGAQMDGFIHLFREAIGSTGIDDSCIFASQALELPGFFRPTKKWDLLVVSKGKLLAAIEAKSQVGPSFGNNFNNRTEEAIGSALDLWTAFREGAINRGVGAPFLGYFFMLEDCKKSQKPTSVKEPHFSVFDEFVDASYMKRYELLCRKLVRERCYSATAFITSRNDTGLHGTYSEPADDLKISSFLQRLIAEVAPHVD